MPARGRTVGKFRGEPMTDDLGEHAAAQASPADYVREFMQQLEHPETRLRTDTRRDGSDVYGGTSWGDAGKAAILGAISEERALRIWLDKHCAPTVDEGGEVLSLVGRVKRLIDM